MIFPHKPFPPIGSDILDIFPNAIALRFPDRIGAYYPEYSLTYLDLMELKWDKKMLPIIWLEEATHQATLDLSWLKEKFRYDCLIEVQTILSLIERAREKNINITLPLRDFINTSQSQYFEKELIDLRERLEINRLYKEDLEIPIHAFFLFVFRYMIDCLSEGSNSEWQKGTTSRNIGIFVSRFDKLGEGVIPNEARNLFDGFTNIKSLKKCYQQYIEGACISSEVLENSIVLEIMKDKTSPMDFFLLLVFIFNPFKPGIGCENWEHDPKYSISKRLKIVTEIVKSMPRQEDLRELIPMALVRNSSDPTFSRSLSY
jgi:hypothetical protein